MPIKFDPNAQNYANSRGLKQLSQHALQKLDQDRNGSISLEEAAQKSSAAGLNGDGYISALERTRLSQLLGISPTEISTAPAPSPTTQPTQPTPTTQPTRPSSSTTSSPLAGFLEQNPDIQTNQDMINTAFRRAGNTFSGATRFVETLGLKMSDLTSDRQGSIRDHLERPTQPSQPTPSTTPTSRPTTSPNNATGLRLSPELLARHDRYDRGNLQDWENLINNNLQKSPKEKLQLANAFFNSRLTYTSDERAWQQRDYWATPVESIAKGGGDCDDFAIGKYITLRKMGIPPQDLKLAFVYYMEPGKMRQAHMVLLHQPPGEKGTILDNIDRGLKTIEQRDDLVSVFTFNDVGMWLSQGNDWNARLAGTTAQLSKWQDALGRMREEGIL